MALMMINKRLGLILVMQTHAMETLLDKWSKNERDYRTTIRMLTHIGVYIRPGDELKRHKDRPSCRFQQHYF